MIYMIRVFSSNREEKPNYNSKKFQLFFCIFVIYIVLVYKHCIEILQWAAFYVTMVPKYVVVQEITLTYVQIEISG